MRLNVAVSTATSSGRKAYTETIESDHERSGSGEWLAVFNG